MVLTVNEIRKIWNDGQAELVAGKKGLSREVLVYDMMEQPDIKPWIRKGVVLITTGYAIRNDKEALLKLIRDLYEGEAAALAIKTRFFSHFPQEALQLANELDFPLFFLNNSMGFIEVVSPVMVALVEAKNNMKMSTRYQIGQVDKKELDQKLFFAIEHDKNLEEKEVIVRANSLRWPSPPFRLMAVNCEEESLAKMCLKLELFFKKNNNDYLSFPEKKRLFFLFSEPPKLKTFRKDLEEYTKELEFHIGISGLLQRYLDISGEIGYLWDLKEIGENPYVDQKILWREEWRYEELLLKISRMPEIRAYTEDRLASLRKYDAAHDTELEKTLVALLKHHGVRKLAAEELYLHRNTMIYRVKKIEEIMSCNLSDEKIVKELEFVCRMSGYYAKSSSLSSKS